MEEHAQTSEDRGFGEPLLVCAILDPKWKQVRCLARRIAIDRGSIRSCAARKAPRALHSPASRWRLGDIRGTWCAERTTVEASASGNYRGTEPQIVDIDIPVDWVRQRLLRLLRDPVETRRSTSRRCAGTTPVGHRSHQLREEDKAIPSVVPIQAPWGAGPPVRVADTSLRDLSQKSLPLGPVRLDASAAHRACATSHEPSS